MALTTAQLLDEYERYREASPLMSEQARLVLAERILRQMKRCAT
ncbi:hypothetical protein NY057_05130 [Curtobacterium flaccumfaciens]|nr:hypothetical protein [Curtobacterium flaccumfaciens]UWD83629.1 hypothetical protein NY057_05130 [Curtobacterium flaccumfaciens]